MKKVFKIVVVVIVVLLVLLIGFIATLPMTIAPLVKKGVAAGGPRALGVSMSVGDVKLKPILGQLTLSDLKIGNPKGYSAKDSFAVKTVDIALDTGSIIKGDTIYIKKILIDSPAILYETKDGMSNFDKMLEKAKTTEKEDAAKGGPKNTEGKPRKKVVIGEFILKGSKVSYSSKMTFGKVITISLPPVKVNDIGKSSGGVTGVEALGEVIPEIINGLKDAVTGAASSIGGGATDAAKKSGEAAKAVAESTTKAATDAAESASKAAKDVGKKLKGLFGK